MPVNSKIKFSFVFSKPACLSLLLCLSGCAAPEKPADVTETDAAGQAYLGAALAASGTDRGVRIVQVPPGPLKQALQTAHTIDIESQSLLSIDGAAVTLANFNDILSRYSPGQDIQLMFSNAAEPDTLSVTLGNKDDWTGPLVKSGRPFATDRRISHLPDIKPDSDLTMLIKHELDQNGLRHDIDTLHELFYEWQQRDQGFHSLSRVMFSFQQPFQLPLLEQTITAPLQELSVQPEQLFIEIASNLDLPQPALPTCYSASINQQQLEQAILTSQQAIDNAFSAFPAAERYKTLDDLYYLLTNLSQRIPPAAQQLPERSLAVMNSSMRVDYQALLSATTAFSCLLDKDLFLDTEMEPGRAIPGEIRKALSGDITGVLQIHESWVVIGSKADNRYDMSVIDVVFDPGGNDTYHTPRTEPAALKVIIDKQGNDRYQSDEAGVAAGTMGISIVVDHAGNDRYSGKLGGNGAGLMGIGILIDYSGKDSYQAEHFSNGAAFYGAGILIDAGLDADVYESTSFSQGFAGPRGFGLLYDEKGNDLYRVNQSSPSVYGTAAVYSSFSQGFGFGLRGYDTGGIGVIYDADGDDRYEGGEFSQAGGYFWALGIIHDQRGDDLYYGNRYSQGFGVHQATGILVDGAGNDSYWGMTAACQGAAWDVALGLLLDIDGNDSYSGDNLCQGAAAMQAQAWLIDIRGQDHYIASGPSVQGRSGQNTYHYDPEKPVFSWSLMLDLDNAQDYFSSGHRNDSSTYFSDIDSDVPENSRVNGLFMDNPAVQPISIY